MTGIVNRILKVFSENGLFIEGVELIGSWCFVLYQHHLGVKVFPLRTPDIDFCVPHPYKGKKKMGFIKQLEYLGFRSDFNSDGSVYLYNPDLKIEFLTCERGKGSDNALEIKELGLRATPLRYMSLLLEKPIVIEEDGIKVKVPNPINFCLHKLLVASKRKKPEKKLKDIEQAVYVFMILDPKKLSAQFKALPKKWQKTILDVLGYAKLKAPQLLKDGIDRLCFTLQNIK